MDRQLRATHYGMSYLGTRSIPFAVSRAVASGDIKNLTNALAESGSLEPLLTPAVCRLSHGAGEASGLPFSITNVSSTFNPANVQAS